MRKFKVSGYKPLKGNTIDYYIAFSESDVMADIKRKPDGKLPTRKLQDSTGESFFGNNDSLYK